MSQSDAQIPRSQLNFEKILNSAIATAIVCFRVFPNYDWICDYQSPGCEAIFGYTAQEIMTNQNLWMLGVHPEDRETVIMPLYEYVFSGRTVTVEYRFNHKDGSQRWISATYTSHYVEDAQCWIVTGTNFDISDRKQIEESLRQSEARFQHLAANLPGNIYTLVQSPDGSLNFEYMSSGIEKILEVTAQQVLENPMLCIEPIHPDDLPRYNDAVSQSYQNLEPFTHQWRIITPSGKLKWLQGNSMPELRHNGDVAWYGLVQDVSESKCTESALRQSEERYRAIFDLTFQFVGLLTHDGTILSANQTALDFAGLEHSDVVNRPFWSARWWTISSATQSQLKTAIAQAAAGEFVRYQVDVLGVGDNIATIDFSLKPIKDHTGQVVQLIAEGRDITDLKRAELELIRSRDFREAIFNKSSDALFLVDAKTLLTTDCNDRAVELFEATNKAELIGFDGQTLQKERFTPEVVASIVEQVDSKGFWSQEIEYFTKQGNFFWGNLAVKEIKVAGEIIHLVRVTDISERKQAELALKEREAMLRGIGDNLHNGLVYQVIRELDGRFGFSYLSAGIERLIEITAPDVLKDPSLLFRQFFQPDCLQLHTAIEESYRNLSVLDLHIRIHTPSGKIKCLHFRSRPRQMHDGRVAWDGLAVDITDLKNYQDRLEESQQVARLGNWEYDLATSEISCSKEFFKLYGRDSAQIEPNYQEHLKFYHPEDAAKLDQAVERAIATGQSYKLTLRLRQQDNSYRYVEAIGKAGFNPQGLVIRLYGTLQDITEQHTAQRDRQIAEAALAKSEEQLRLTLEFTYIGTWDWNISTNEVIWNHNHYRLFGLEPETIVPTYQLWQDIIHPEDIEQLELAVYNALEQNTHYEGAEYRVIHPDGSIHWLSGRGRGIYNQAGQPIRMLGIVMDISDRKRAEQMLELQAVITRNMAEGICLVKVTDGVIVYVNPKFEQMFGYDSGELTGKHVSKINYEDEHHTAEAVYREIMTAVNQYGEFPYEVHNVKKDGTPFWCRGTASIFAHPEYGKVLVAVHQNINEQKQADEKIKASLTEKEVLLQEIHHRVKNNLGIVSGLLQMQCRRTQDSHATDILKDSQNRIASIALVHEKLYGSEELAHIDFAQYIPDLTTHLFDSYNVSSQRIQLNIQVDHASLDIETAIPCGLIINELVSNALKYAFPDHRSGEIQVRFSQESSGHLTLILRDNGVGLPTDLDSKKAKTLGLTLVQGLVKQIRGTLEINCQQGTEFKITFTNSRT
ncbi:PAS domain-containing protein [Nodularia sphaerocarpa]|uniref:PAS domain-containing protein n=1 Tax=Nodularia sphaerocarpa TaxID=137816 RepID=UPI001EFC09CC|nr:PAS domain-containing protein [Nodularia sphaerocarpa]MDB9372818.1 PAS domain-containing protein [Nodularia sphaerocarpa CS-585]MDB9379383.1 PAS domain-containing protein [Nodularia sphaerocarpa CS-585A2]ULP71590.1 Sensor histidine kinase TodS [Nodularia sphaerocarpa UHCC 0038]